MEVFHYSKSQNWKVPRDYFQRHMGMFRPFYVPWTQFPTVCVDEANAPIVNAVENKADGTVYVPGDSPPDPVDES